jgi:hypothetical protein
MDKKEFHWVFGVMQGLFSAKHGSKISDGIPCGHQQPQGNNKQESTTFFHPYGSNKQEHCMDKEEFHWISGVMQSWFSENLGVKNHL